MSDSRTCPQCSAKMICIATRYANPKGRRTTRYRIRTFKCLFCECEEAVYADGRRDDNEKYDPNVDTK